MYIFKNFKEEDVKKIIQFHKDNGGISRFEKIRYFYSKIIKKPLDEKTFQKLSDQFSKYCLKNMTNEKILIQETVDFIKNNYKKYNFHIVSGSEHNELNYLCEKLGIKKYFLSIQGSPTPKNDLVKNLLIEYKYDLNETILIGDSINDYEAAKINKIKFFGYNNIELKELSGYYVDDFDESLFNIRL